MNPREELEARLTALLLGELSADEAVALCQAIAQDAELARLHHRLQQAIALVRETVSVPEAGMAASPDATRLAPERREKLLAAFKVVQPQEFKRARWPKVNWGKVKWRDYAALAAMVMGLLGIAAVLMNRLMGESREGSSLGLDFLSYSKAPQRLTTIAGLAPSEAAPAAPTRPADSLADGRAADKLLWRTITAEPAGPVISDDLMTLTVVPANGQASPGATERRLFDTTIALPESARSEVASRGYALDGALAGTGFTASLWGAQAPPVVDNKIQISGQVSPVLESGRFGNRENFAAYLGDAQQNLAQQQSSANARRSPATAPAPPLTVPVAPPPIIPAVELGTEAKISGGASTRHFAGIALPAVGDSVSTDERRVLRGGESDRAVRSANLADHYFTFEANRSRESLPARSVLQAGSGPGSGSAEQAGVAVAVNRGPGVGGAHGGGGGFAGGGPRPQFAGEESAPAASRESAAAAGRDDFDVDRKSQLWVTEGLAPQPAGQAGLTSGGGVGGILMPIPVSPPAIVAPPVALAQAVQDDVGGPRSLYDLATPAPTPVPAPQFVNQGMITANPVAADDGGVQSLNGTVMLRTTATPAKPASASEPLAQAIQVQRRRVDSLAGNGAFAANAESFGYFDTGAGAAPAQQLTSRSGKALDAIADQTKEAKPGSASEPQAQATPFKTARFDSLDGGKGFAVRTNGAAAPVEVNYFASGISAAPAQQLASRSGKMLGDLADQVVMETRPASILSGDRNLTRPAGTIAAGNTWSETAAALDSTRSITFEKNLDNISLGDGSAQQAVGNGLQKQITSAIQGNATRLDFSGSSENKAPGIAPEPVTGLGAAPAFGRASFANRLNHVVSRAASGPGEGLKEVNATPLTAGASGVYSANAVGFQTAAVNDPATGLPFEAGISAADDPSKAFLDGDGMADTSSWFGTVAAGGGLAVTKGIKLDKVDGRNPKPVVIDATLASVDREEPKLRFSWKSAPATDLPVPNPYSRADIVATTKADGKDGRTGGEELDGVSKISGLGDVPVIGGMFRKSVKGKSEGYVNGDLGRLEPERMLEETTARRQARVEIALPQGERGEALEKLRVATGPLVVNEVMANDPATGLPVPQDGLVELQTDSLLVTNGSFDYVVGGGDKSDDQSGLTDAALRTVGLGTLNRQLETSLAIRDRLLTRVWSEKVDAAMPKTAIVEVIEKAEAQSTQPTGKPSLWGRIRGTFSSDTERTARISVQKDATDVQLLGGQSAASGFDPHWVQTQFEKIQSKAVLEKAAEKLNLNETWAGKYGGGEKLRTEDTVKRLKKMIDVSQNRNTSLLSIKAKSDDPEEAARIANAVAEAYQASRTERWKSLSKGGLQALEGEIAKQDKTIDELAQKLGRQKKELKQVQTDVPLPKLAAGAGVPQPEVATAENAFSTFSLNVSDVSFKLAAASLEKGQMPDPATVRSEEFINAFDYRDPEPAGSAPIAFAWERARYPFAHDRDLLRFSVKTAASGRQPGRPLNLVLLLDNSGSMERADRVRIREACLRVLARQLRPEDRVSVVAFARTARLWVDDLPGSQAGELAQRVGGLAPEGGTNLEDAMNVAYQTALKHFLANGVNRVVLLTDGAANLGDVQPESLKKKVEAHRAQGVALDCFGIGWDGLNDELLEALSRNGDGRYGFVNSPEAATTEFAAQLAGALKVAASDVKVQVEWNPRRVSAYRQVGYAKHQLKKEQFRDNTVDAAEIGAAEAGNALYTVQVNPRGEGPLGTVRVRFKVPGTSDYREHEWPLTYDGGAKPLDQSSPALRLAASASAFSEWLVSSPFAAEVTPDKLLGYLSGVPETWPADPRPKKLEWMIRQARNVAGK